MGETTIDGPATASPFVERWAPLVGLDGADCYQRALVLLRAMLGALIPGLTLSLVYEATDRIVLLGMGLALLAVGVCLLVFALMFMQRSFRAMSKFFGVHVWVLNAPSFTAAAYRRWCERNGVQPQG